MYLKSLQVQGFKSFPDKTLIRFGDEITAIVGPNGSGKSNISDAILWVLGEQSTKTLRGAKMEDVIFGGTQKRPALGFAEATLTLDNSDRALLYDADEVMVTRRYYRSGDSEYYINRQSARLRDINEMFMDTGLGREGYSNIGQGRIDEILALKSGDRREIFEEAAGISKYRHRKEETERQLAKTEDNLLRIGDKVSELELQLEPLKKQSEKAKQYLALKDELQSAEVALWLESLDKLGVAAKKAEEDYASAAFVLKQAHEDLEKLYARAEDFAAALREKDGELDTAREKVNLLEATHQQLDGQVAVLRGNVENHSANIARLEQERKGSESRAGSLAEQISTAECQIAAIGESLSGKRAELGDAQQEFSAITASAQGITKQFLELRGRQNSLVADSAGREAERNSLAEAMERANVRDLELQVDLDAGCEREQAARSARDRCRRELKQAQEDVTAANNAIAGYTLRLNTRCKRRDDLDAQLRQQTAQLDGISAKVRVFQAMERDFDSYQKSVRLVMQQSQRGALRGIHGPVSRLIRTEDAYTVAIEIALGGAMQQLVVSSEQDAKAAIDYLKRSGGGRATFLPLTSVQGRRLGEAGLESCRGFVGIASQLVSSDAQYAGIVENLLGRTVIVRDLAAAIAMAKAYHNRFKIVTLDGQVMTPGGSMTGGSVSREAGLLSRANELEKLTAQEKTLREQCDRLDAELREAKRLADEVGFQMDAAREQLRAAEDCVLRLQGQEKQEEILLQAVLSAQSAAREEQKALHTRAASDRERWGALQAQLEMLGAQLGDLKRQLDTLENSRTDAASRAEALQEKMADRRAEIAALEAQAETARSHIDDLEKLRQSIVGDQDQKQALVESFRQEIARLEKQIAELLHTQEENDASAERQKRAMQRIFTERAEAEASKTRSEREAQEKNKDILNMERACALLEQKKLTSQMEEKQIADKLWDNYGLTPGTAEKFRGKVESAAAANREIASLKRKISLLGVPNLGAIEEYERVLERYTYLSDQRDDVLTSKRDLEGIVRDITREMTSIFVEEFGKIDRYFSETFTEMFGGGKGRLILEDAEHPLEGGIESRVQPPG